MVEAQDCLPDNEVRDAFAADFSVLNQLWEAISPDPVLTQYKNDYRWLSQVYESVQPPSGIVGRLVWHRLGPKTLEIINENIHVDQFLGLTSSVPVRRVISPRTLARSYIPIGSTKLREARLQESTALLIR